MKQLGASGRRSRAAVTDGKAGIAYRPMFLLSADSVCQDGRARAQDLQLATLSYPTSPPLRGFAPFVAGGVYAERDAFELKRDIGMIKRTRSEERRVGNESVSTCRSRWCPSN